MSADKSFDLSSSGEILRVELNSWAEGSVTFWIVLSLVSIFWNQMGKKIIMCINIIDGLVVISGVSVT